MAVPAVDARIADVVLMAKGNGLHPDNALLGEIGRPHKCRSHGHRREQEEHQPEDAHSGERVHAGVKNLRHEMAFKVLGRLAIPTQDSSIGCDAKFPAVVVKLLTWKARFDAQPFQGMFRHFDCLWELVRFCPKRKS